jgi:hypothetical protein
MTMKRLFEGKVGVDYGQMSFVDNPENMPDDMAECFGGQENGLCGAAMPGVLFLLTGLHSGQVHMSIDLSESEPPLDDLWEEVVEVSFVVGSPAKPGILEWAAQGWHPVKLKRGTYRARYCAKNMQSGQEHFAIDHHEEPVDSYLLIFWPAPRAKDRILKQSSKAAAYWHSWVRELPPSEWEPQ